MKVKSNRNNLKGVETTDNGQVVVDWRAEPLERISVVLRRKNDRKFASRKVKMRGTLTEQYVASETGISISQLRSILTAIRNGLMHGYEVRLFDSVRFFAMIDADMRTMHPTAQTMGEWRTNALNGVEFDIMRGRKCITTDDAQSIVSANAKRYARQRESVIEVTPDTMVSCPKCGTQFRIGKSLTKSANAAERC